MFAHTHHSASAAHGAVHTWQGAAGQCSTRCSAHVAGRGRAGQHTVRCTRGRARQGSAAHGARWQGGARCTGGRAVRGAHVAGQCAVHRWQGSARHSGLDDVAIRHRAVTMRARGDAELLGPAAPPATVTLRCTLLTLLANVYSPPLCSPKPLFLIVKSASVADVIVLLVCMKIPKP